MRRIYYISVLLAALLGTATSLYAGDDDSNSFGLRFSGEVDYKIMSGLHIFASEELRLLGGSNGFDRNYLQAGVSYKICDYLKAAVFYTSIAAGREEVTLTGTEQQIEWRHRVSGELTASFSTGQWKFSLRERIQGTYKMRELNNYQQPQMGWVLRSRLKASYEFRSVPLEPYIYFEPRLLLNGAKWGPESTGTNFGDADFLGHKDVYFNRYRASAGLEWRLTRRSSLDFYCLFDHLYDKDIDARKEGSSKGVGLKKAITGVSANVISLGVGYKFAF